MSLRSLKVVDLISLCREKSLSYSRKNKDELIKMLEEHSKSVASPSRVVASHSRVVASHSRVETRLSTLNSMTVINLRNMCKEKNYKNYTKYNKKELIEFIMNQSEYVADTFVNNSTRSSVEFNGMELVCALLIIEPKIKSYNDLEKCLPTIQKYRALKFNEEDDYKEYIKDIQKKEKIVSEYISNFRLFLKDLRCKPIETVFIAGKLNKHDEIEKLNEGLCKLETKSDIYIKYRDNTFVGLSVKQSKDCTKSNYSVQKMLGEKLDTELTLIKKKYLEDKGFNKFLKSQRKEVNALFYPQNRDNPYMNRLRKEIKKNSDKISKTLVQKLYCSNINYDIYEFNGVELVKLNCDKDLKVYFEEHLPYYYDTKNNERKTAKLFYRLIVNDKTYRIEVRWKGNVFSCSPQFQMHEE
jgi:hypothetical protein